MESAYRTELRCRADSSVLAAVLRFDGDSSYQLWRYASSSSVEQMVSIDWREKERVTKEVIDAQESCVKLDRDQL